MIPSSSPAATGAPLLRVDADTATSGRPWRARLGAAGERQALAIAQRYDVPEILARVLAGRDVAIDDAERFLEPSVRALLPDPSTLTDCETLVRRLADAVTHREPIAIIADYDVDGATSAAMLIRVLRALGAEPLVHVPDRLTEGYGPSEAAVARLAEAGAKVLVTLDCGTAAHAPLALARERGLDTLVIDHHPVEAELAPAFAIVNPNRQDDLSGLGHLAAVGVTFVVLVALNRELRRRGAVPREKEPDLLALLDLAALGTVCDVVPLKGLNRAFVVKGLIAMSRRGNLGLAALADAARLHGPPSAYHLGFLLGPRINAGGRIGEADLGVRLLTAERPEEVERLAFRLDRLNEERQTIEGRALEEADAMVTRELVTGAPPPVLFVAGEGWHPGVVGLVAARLKERYRRPAFAIALGDGGDGTGSGRSIAGVDLGRAVRAAVAAGLASKGGGHPMAAGLSVAAARRDDLKAFLCATLADDVAAARARDALKIDGVLTAAGASEALVELIERAGPYGAGHPEPVFAFPDHKVVYCDATANGHLRVTLAAPGGGRLEAMAFRAEGTALGRALSAAREEPHQFAGSLMLDRYRGVPKVKLRLIDAAPAAAARTAALRSAA